MKLKIFVLKVSLLESLSRPELIKLTYDQAKMIGNQAKIIAELKNKIEEQEQDHKKDIQRFTSKIEELTRSSKRQAAPFRREEKKLKKKKRKPGRKTGHKGEYRKFTGKPDHTVAVNLDKCPECGQTDFHDIEKVEQMVEEIEARVVRTKLITYKGRCGHCHTEIETDHPLKISNARGAAGTYIGPMARSLALSLTYEFGLSKRKTTDILNKVFGLRLSPGGLVHMSHKAAEVMKEEYDKLRESIRQSRVVHADETSWYVGNPKNWLWTFTNKNHTLYQVKDTRARQVIYDLLGENYQGVLVSDCLAIYDDVNEIQQKCYAHHLKALKNAEELASGHVEDIWLVQELKSLLKNAIRIKKFREQVGESRYQTGIQNIEKQANELIPPLGVLEEQIKKGHYDRYRESTQKVLKRLARQKDHLFTFLYYDYVDATNNLAERQLRPAVISRKISCGNKTPHGAKTWEVLTSLMQTWKQQEKHFDKKLTKAYHDYLLGPVPT